MKEIALSRGKSALVDDEDYEWLSQWKWTYAGENYAYRMQHLGVGADGKAKKKSILMHRIITNAPKGLDVDHVNRDGLDNQRHNLRVCTRTQNLANSIVSTGRYSNLRGAFLDKKTGLWSSKIMVNRKLIRLGWFTTDVDAHEAYKAASVKYNGKFSGYSCLETMLVKSPWPINWYRCDLHFPVATAQSTSV
jgi:hypothetical protein